MITSTLLCQHPRHRVIIKFMYRLRFLITILSCLVRPTRNLLGEFKVSFIAIPLIDTDFTRLFTHTYSSYMAICRWHFVFNSQFRNVALKRRWVPVTTAENMEYRRSIKAFQRVTVSTRLICWNDKRFYLEQKFLIGGNLHANCILEGLIRGPSGILQPPEVFAHLGVKSESPPVPPHIEHWLCARV